MDEQIAALVDALAFFDADDVKKMQTKLTKTANSIIKDGLHPHIEPFLSVEEREALHAAAKILRSVKGKVEHVKEIKARAEKKAKQHRELCTRKQHALIDTAFPRPDNDVGYRNTLLWRLACGVHFKGTVGKSYAHFPEVRRVQTDIDRWSEKPHQYRNTETVKSSVWTWRDDIMWSLKENLWDSEELPEQERIDALIATFTNEWVPQLEKNFASLIEALENELIVNDSDSVTRLRAKPNA